MEEQFTPVAPETRPKGLPEWVIPYLTPLSVVVSGLVITASILYAGGLFQSGQDSGSRAVPSAQLGAVAPPPAAENDGPGNVVLDVTGEDHIRGNPSAPVTIVEFSDLQCPFCSRFHLTLQQVLDEYGDKVRWAYKHFPLDVLHPEARPSAEASECVWEQTGNDGFWQFVDGVSENQSRIGSALYRELAQQIGLNMSQFDDCVASSKYQQKVEDDYQQGVTAGVRGTPANFVNGEPLPGAVPYETLKAAIDGALGQ